MAYDAPEPPPLSKIEIIIAIIIGIAIALWLMGFNGLI